MSYFTDIQFLNLEDVSKEEIDEINTILYSSSRQQSSVLLPWNEQQIDWSHQGYEADASECSESGTECYVPGQQGQLPNQGQVSTSLHQVYSAGQVVSGQVVQAVPQVVSYISTAPPGYYHQQPPHTHTHTPSNQLYDGARRRSKTSPKCTSAGTSPSPGSPAPPSGATVAPPSPYHAPLGPYSYPLVPPPPPPGQFPYMGGGMPGAQHATGPPLYFPSTVYTPAPPHIYSQYPPHQQVYNAALHSPHPTNPAAVHNPERNAKDETQSSISQQVSPAVLPVSETSNVATSTQQHVQVSNAATQSIPNQHVPTQPTVSDIDVGIQRMIISQVVQPVGPSPGHQVLIPISTTTGQHHLPLTPSTHNPTQHIHQHISITNSNLTIDHPDNNDTNKALENEEFTKVSPQPKSLPPINAIKVVAPPPSGGIKSNPVKTSSPSNSNLPPPVVPAIPGKRKAEDEAPVSPTVVAPPTTSLTSNNAPVVTSVSPLPPVTTVESSQQTTTSVVVTQSSIPPILPTPPLSSLQPNKSSWASVLKNDNKSSINSNQSIPQNAIHNSNHSSTDPSNSAKVSKMLKGPPPQHAVALTPIPSHLTAPTYHHHNNSQNSAPSNTSTSSDKLNKHAISYCHDPTLYRVAELLSEYKLENKAVVLVPRGLNNPSNYCYINATLQALLACAPFYNLIKTLSKIKPVNNSGNSKSHTPVIDSMIQFVNEFSQAPTNRLRKERGEKAQARKEGGGIDNDPSILPGPSFEPSYVYKMVHNSFSMLQLEARQEDAEEFLTGLLNGLNDEMLELLKLKGVGLSNGDVTTNGDSHPEMDNSDWKEVISSSKGISRVTRRTEVGKTPLTDIFMGQMRSRLERSDPQLSTDNIQPFYSLHLDVESCNTVEEALAKMTSEKEIEGVSKGETTITSSYIDQLPLVLILHLKCIHYSNGKLTKISKSFEYPIDLRLGSKLVQTNKSKQLAKGTCYKLFAVVYHDGKEATKGHYLSDVYHVGSSCWIRYDDTQVKSVSEHHVLNPKSPRVPYLLLYRRVDKHTRS